MQDDALFNVSGLSNNGATATEIDESASMTGFEAAIGYFDERNEEDHVQSDHEEEKEEEKEEEEEEEEKEEVTQGFASQHKSSVTTGHSQKFSLTLPSSVPVRQRTTAAFQANSTLESATSLQSELSRSTAKSQIRAASFTVGDLMVRKKSAAVDAKRENVVGAKESESGPVDKDGWNILSRRFHVTCALNSLSTDLKTFGARPQERAMERETLENETTATTTRRRCMLRPDKQWYMKYVALNAALLTYCAFSIPIRVSFDFELSTSFAAFELAIDIFFIVDIFVNFRTGYIDDGESFHVEMCPSKICKRYAKSWLLVDILAAIPFNLFFGDNSGNADRLPRMLRMPRLVRILRLLRLVKLLKLVQAIDPNDHDSSAAGSAVESRLPPRLLRALRFMFLTVVCSHIIACGWYFWHSFLTADDPTRSTWWTVYCNTIDSLAPDRQICDCSLYTRYAISLYWAVTTLTTIGYGDICPITACEYIYTTLCMYIGVSFYAYVAANVATVLATLDSSSEIQNKKMDRLNEFLKVTNLPDPLKRRMRKYFSLYWSRVGALIPHDTSKLIREINLPGLRNEVTRNLYCDAIERIPFLKGKDSQFISAVVTKLVPLHVSTQDYAVREGQVGGHIFFLWHGKMQVVHHERTLRYVVEGSYFGDMAVFILGRHIVSFQAHSKCELYILSKSDLERALLHSPSVGLEMRELATSRLGNTRAQIANSSETSDGKTPPPARTPPLTPTPPLTARTRVQITETEPSMLHPSLPNGTMADTVVEKVPTIANFESAGQIRSPTCVCAERNQFLADATERLKSELVLQRHHLLSSVAKVEALVKVLEWKEPCQEAGASCSSK